MWLSFVLVFATYLLLFVPNALLLFGLGFDIFWSATLSPLVSISAYAIIGQALAIVGIPSSAPILVAPILSAALIAALLVRRKGKTVAAPSVDRFTALLYLGVGLTLGLLVYLKNLPSPDALFQAFDTAQHLNVIRAFADSGRFSSLGVSAYLTEADKAICPAASSGFYPSAWHAFCALAVQLTQCKVTVAINASEFVMTSIAYPLGWAALLTLAFDGDKNKVRAGSIVCMAFASFPWQLIMFGPIYPNLVGFCVLPSAMALFMLVFLGSGRRTSVTGMLVFLPCLAGLALLHPNTIFTALVLLMFWCARLVYDALARVLEDRPKLVAKAMPWAGWTAFLLLCLAFWIFCYRLPAFHEIVSHNWKTYATQQQMLYNLFALTYTNDFCYNLAPQFLLGVLVIVGAVRAAFSGKTRWITLSYLVAGFILFWVATYTGIPGRSRFLLGGFWYTDPMRLASMFVLASIPCAALGLSYVAELLDRLGSKRLGGIHVAGHKVATIAVVIAVFALVNYFPGFYKSPQEVRRHPDMQSTDFHTAFGDMCYIVTDVYDSTSPLSQKEKDFLAKATPIVGDDLVINDPADGSLFAYGDYGIRTYYRTLTGVGAPNETLESQRIRTWLSHMAQSPDTREALKKTGARYVLVLDDSDAVFSFINLRGTGAKSRADFHGVDSVGADTPGLKLVLSSGDRLRLYKIVG